MRVIDSSAAPMAQAPVGATAAGWNRLAASFPHHTIYQSWAWGEGKRRERFRPLRFTSQNETGAAQLLWRRAPLLPAGVIWVPGGPLALDPTSYLKVLRSLRTEAKRLHSVLVVAPAFSRKDPLVLALTAAGYERSSFNLSPQATFQVDLARSEEQILAGLHPRWRYDLRKSRREGVQVRHGHGPDLATAFLRLYRETAVRAQFKPTLDEATLDACLAAAGDGADVRIFLASHQGADLAGAVVTLFGHEARLVWAGSSSQGRNVMPSEAMHWDIMLWAQTQGARVYDLHGSGGSPGSGRFEFKNRFGGTRVELAGTWMPRPDGIWERLLTRLLKHKLAGRGI